MSRVAVITGASRGIGAATARKLAADGFAVVVNYMSGQDAAQAVVADVVAAGGRAVAVQGDVADEAAVAALFERAEQEYGGVDVVVNSAGRMTLSTVAELDLDALDAMHRTNIRGHFVVAREAARRLRDNGAFVGVSTSVVGAQLPTYAAYTATKGAVEASIMIFARELRGRGITVNAVAPGPTATELFLDGKSAELVDRMAKMNPLERLGQPEDIANTIAFLVGPAGRWINGQTVRANGGMV